MAIANYTKKINGMRSIPQSHTIRSSKNYLKTTPERYMTPPDIFDLVLILRALMHHLSGIFGFLIGWCMTKNHLRIVSRERSLKCMLSSKCNGRLLLTFFGQKGRDLADRTGLPVVGYWGGTEFPPIPISLRHLRFSSFYYPYWWLVVICKYTLLEYYDNISLLRYNRHLNLFWRSLPYPESDTRHHEVCYI